MQTLYKLFSCFATALFCTGASAQTLVQKVAEPFESVTWRGDSDSSAGGGPHLSANVPAELAAKSKGSLELQADFSGTGFEFFKAVPTHSLVIPGVTKSLSLWVRADAKYGWVLQFKDGWGRSEAGGQKLEWNITKGADGAWKKVSFNVPPTWVQPLTIDGVQVHNWDAKTQKASAILGLDQLEIESDIADVDENSGILKTWKTATAAPGAPPDKNLWQKAPATPLLNVSLAGTEAHNVFSGAKPQFVLTAQNWRPAAASGALQWKVFDPQGDVLKSGNETINVEDNFSLSLPLDIPRFGVYRLDSTIAWQGGKTQTTSQPFAVIPIAKELTGTEKDASPYGLNVHSGGDVMVSEFRKAGIVWFRDYGFNYDWMLRAKGADKSYGGWPWYPKIVQKYKDNDVRVLANLATALKPPTEGHTSAGFELGARNGRHPNCVSLAALF